MRKVLGVFEVFLGVFEKTKEKKDREFVFVTDVRVIGKLPRKSFKVIFNIAGSFYFARLFLETLQKYP